MGRADGVEARRAAKRGDRRIGFEIASETECGVRLERGEGAGSVAGSRVEDGARPVIRRLRRPRRRRRGALRRAPSPDRRRGAPRSCAPMPPERRRRNRPLDAPAPGRRAAAGGTPAATTAGGAVESCGDAERRASEG
jgi:hypothetical protein